MAQFDFESLSDLAGQRLMLGFDGQTLNTELKHLINEYRAGGIILFRPNIESPDQLRRLCMDARDYALDQGLPDLFVAVDQEGGQVARLRKPFTEFPGNPHMTTLEEAREFARITASELFDMGINMNMAPVMDVVPPDVDSIMKDRVFTGNENRVAEMGTAVIQGLQKGGVLSVAKHFPGIGRTVKDSHFFLPELETELSDLKQTDLIPFEAAKKVQVSGMMLSHILYTRLDANWQASLSKTIAYDLLRKGMGYQGLVMTDDLDMKAISHDMDTCIYRIMAAQIDIALVCHAGPNIAEARNAVRGYLEKDKELFESGIACVKRILAAKEQFLV
ncbi:glycoside hydrolase family 3 N-terminal domain-containing protein [uncultured Desulfobacter sp.]|uniref:glycoside hydrolase family 3 N-terminal domain-containing protein n=1 Tax=uncultured Desulfobacter sp. TaxID=240139 RepID=UPI002AA76B00|nr:glycoside hydrolase family 3 N-terminal domain-containing protein [uncultured Desulfobacter sp.]